MLLNILYFDLENDSENDKLIKNLLNLKLLFLSFYLKVLKYYA